MKYQLNRKAFERLKALVRAGKYVDRAWSFGAADANQLLDSPPNWPEYQQWMLGIQQGKPDSALLDGTDGNTPHKDWFAYAFGKGDVVNLAALRSIVKQAGAVGEADIADAAQVALSNAEAANEDKNSAGGETVKTPIGEACDKPLQLTSKAAVIAAAAAGPGGKKLPTFEADAYTGVAMVLDGWEYPVAIDYDGLDTTAHSRPVLRDHDPKLPLGHTTSVFVRDGVLKAAGVISGSGKHVDEVVEAGKNSFPWQISVGMKVLKNQFIPAGRSAQANGKTFDGPVNIARQTSLREISFLSLGADDNTSGRIAASAAKVKPMKRKFAAWMKARGFKAADLDEAGTVAAKVLYKAQMKCEADDASDADDDGKDGQSADAGLDIQAGAAGGRPSAGGNADAGEGGSGGVITAAGTIKEIRAAALAERKRMAAITATLDQYRPRVDAEKFADIEAKAIGGEYNPERMELELIKAARPDAPKGPYINTGKGSAPDGAIIAAAAARSMGVGEKAAMLGLDEKSGNIAASLRITSMHQIIAMSAERLGIHVTPGGIDDSFLEEFIPQDKASHRQQLRAARSGGMIRASSGAGASTMSLTGITENILNKAMLEQYNLQTSVVSEIAYERDTTDFKPFKVYRLTASGDFEPLGPGGEVKNFSLQDESYANQVVTKAALLVLKREDIINDDMGALMQAPQVMGRKANLNREKTVIATLLSGLTTTAPGASVGKTANNFNFLSTGALNYTSGASSALSITSLGAVEKNFLQQKDANGDPIGILPDRILVGPDLKTTAKNLYNGASIVVSALGSTSSKAVDPNYNSLAGNFKPIVSPYLGSASPLAGATATQWALLCNPAGGMAPIQVGYLRGQRTPVIRQVETDAAMLGIAFQGLFDFGVALLDWRTIQYSAGQ